VREQSAPFLCLCTSIYSNSDWSVWDNFAEFIFLIDSMIYAEKLDNGGLTSGFAEIERERVGRSREPRATFTGRTATAIPL